MDLALKAFGFGVLTLLLYGTLLQAGQILMFLIS
jgi:hypothetical protein